MRLQSRVNTPYEGRELETERQREREGGRESGKKWLQNGREREKGGEGRGGEGKEREKQL